MTNLRWVMTMTDLGDYGSSFNCSHGGVYITDADGGQVYLCDGEPAELRDKLVEVLGAPDHMVVPDDRYDTDDETVVSYDSDEPVTELPDDESVSPDDGPVQTMKDVEERLQALEREVKNTPYPLIEP